VIGDQAMAGSLDSGRSPAAWRRGPALAVVLLAAGVAAALRVPFLGVPLDPDEGGYAHLALRWAAGEQLYSDLWVDRPQGLLLAYRGVVAVAPTPTGLRLAAALAAALLVIGTAAAAWALAGPRAGVVAGVVLAAVGVAPRMRGFTLQGELLAGVATTAAVALALWWDRGGAARRPGVLAASGALAVLGPLVKQSALEGLAVVALVVVASGPGRLRAAGTAALGAAVPLGLAVAHALATGWSDWWFAVVGYRVSTPAGAGGGLVTRMALFADSVGRVWLDLLALALLAAVGAAVAVRRQPRALAPVVWLAAAAIGFAGGAFYHGHYWLQLLPPLAVLGSLAVARVPRAGWAAAVVVLVALAGWVRLATMTSTARAEALVGDDPRLMTNAAVAAWLRASTPPDATLLTYPSSADLYFLADRRATARYLWLAPLSAVPGAVEDQARQLEGADRPDVVVLDADPSAVDPSGRTAAALADHYRTAAVVEGRRVLVSLQPRTPDVLGATRSS
jgi:hypothetical protein